MEIFVVGKQWMWHLQHSEGPREINQLHVPVDVPVRLAMTSEDVIHDFSVPAFRMKMDVVPGRYTSEWFQATKIGSLSPFLRPVLRHSSLRHGRDRRSHEPYRLRGMAARQCHQPNRMVQIGQDLFARLACNTCHLPDGTGAGPALDGVIRQAGEPRERRNSRHRRSLHPAVHPRSRFPAPAELSSGDAHVSAAK